MTSETVVAVHSTHRSAEKINLNGYGMGATACVLGEFGVSVAYIARDAYTQSAAEKLAKVELTNLDFDGQLRLTGEQCELVIGGELGAIRAYSSVALPDWLDDAVPVVN